MAMGGEPTAMRMCLDRLIAPRKERPVSFALPKIETASDLVSATNAIAASVASGELTTWEAAPHADARRPPRERFSPSTFSGHSRSARCANSGPH